MSLNGIKEKMMSSNEYKLLYDKIKKEKYDKVKAFLNWQNLLIVALYVIVITIMFLLAKYADNKYETNVWSERVYTIIISGIIVPIIIASGKLFKKR